MGNVFGMDNVFPNPPCELGATIRTATTISGGGLEKEFANFADLPLHAQVELSGQIKLLTLPGEMGENFKCFGLSRGVSMTPSAFGIADRTMYL